MAVYIRVLDVWSTGTEIRFQNIAAYENMHKRFYVNRFFAKQMSGDCENVRFKSVYSLIGIRASNVHVVIYAQNHIRQLPSGEYTLVIVLFNVC